MGDELSFAERKALFNQQFKLPVQQPLLRPKSPNPPRNRHNTPPAQPSPTPPLQRKVSPVPPPPPQRTDLEPPVAPSPVGHVELPPTPPVTPEETPVETDGGPQTEKSNGSISGSVTSVCSDEGFCVERPESPYASGARRKNTRKAVRRKKASDVESPTTLNPPPPFKPPNAPDRRSLPPRDLPPNLAPPDLPPRRHSYDKQLVVEIPKNAPPNAQAPSQYQYAKTRGDPSPSTPPLPVRSIGVTTKKPPPPPPKSPGPPGYRPPLPPSNSTLPPRNKPVPTQRYKLSSPPPINLNSHPIYNLSTLPQSATLRSGTCPDSPDMCRVNPRSATLQAPRTPPPIPRSAPPNSIINKSPEPPSVPPPPPSIPPPGAGLQVQPSDSDRVSDADDYDDEDDIYGDCLSITRDVDEAPEMETIRRAPSAPTQQINIMVNKGFRQYWHERPEVKESGILQDESLTKKEKSRQEAMFEVLTSEKTYGASLDILFRQVVDDMMIISMLEEEDREVVFMNISDIRVCSKRLIAELEKIYKGQVMVTTVSPILKKFADTEFQVYIEYCSMMTLQKDKLAALRAGDPEFDILISEKERNKIMAGQNLQSYLVQPMQRICRMPLLLSAVLGKTEEDTEEHASILQVYQNVCQIVDKCNEGARLQDNKIYVRALEQRFDFSKIGKVIPITDNPDRQLVKESPVMKLTFKKNKVSSINLIFWLFDDFLLVGHKVDLSDNSDTCKFFVTEHCPRALIKTKSYFQLPHGISAKKKNPTENIFHLELISSSNSRKHIIQCSSVTEKQRWIEVLSPVLKNEYEDETIYAEWDYPLVKTKYPYQSIQADDLDLYEGDVCKVIKKYTDGWCEGIRERDGKQGWFPLSYMEEIQTEHTAYRQIRKRYEAIEKMRTDAEVTNALSKIRQ